jgi:transposase-like protein
MARVAKFTDEQKFEIALELISGKLSHSEVCRKYDISSTYAYKLKDRALEVLRQGIGRPAGRADPEVDRLRKRVSDLEELAGDQALAIRLLKKRHDPA